MAIRRKNFCLGDAIFTTRSPFRVHKCCVYDSKFAFIRSYYDITILYLLNNLSMHDKSTIARSVVIRKITSVSLVRGRKLKIEMWLQIIAVSNCRTVTLNNAEWEIGQSEAA